jgi:hypothetical protein
MESRMYRSVATACESIRTALADCMPHSSRRYEPVVAS